MAAQQDLVTPVMQSALQAASAAPIGPSAIGPSVATDLNNPQRKRRGSRRTKATGPGTRPYQVLTENMPGSPLGG